MKKRMKKPNTHLLLHTITKFNMYEDLTKQHLHFYHTIIIIITTTIAFTIY